MVLRTPDRPSRPPTEPISADGRQRSAGSRVGQTHRSSRALDKELSLSEPVSSTVPEGSCALLGGRHEE